MPKNPRREHASLAMGGLAIFATLAGLFMGIRQFNARQKTSAADPVNQRHQATLDHADRAENKSGWDKASVMVQAVGALAIFVSLAGLIVGVWQFNQQQVTNARDQLDRQHQATLDKFLDDMSDLVLNHQLTSSGPDSPITAIAIARTATALRNLDGDGSSKGILIRFLWNAGLITSPNPILRLYLLDLDGAVFQGARLNQAYLSQLSIVGADFNGAVLSGADLSKSILIGSSLSSANLSCFSQGICTDLSGAYLMRADLMGADLAGADLAGADLDGANLSEARLAGAELHNAFYNIRPEKVTNEQGEPVTNMPTIWPAGFDPKTAGATCDDCPRQG
jgi:hypothetical protein